VKRPMRPDSRQETERMVAKRVIDCASALRAACQPDVGALQALRLAVLFVREVERRRLLETMREEDRHRFSA
jgi:hypothetical protein